jgi:hypothetical protein
MIVLDEEIHGPRIRRAISPWYAGAVMSIAVLRPHTHIQDDAITTLLQTTTRPTFVTINVDDFWLKAPTHKHYAIICVDLPDVQVFELATWLRRCLRMPEFKAKTARMGKVIRLRPSRIEYYAADKRIHTLAWNT